ncbi:LysM peptidoglycan-binding domain-containing protein [Rubrolithibacter danxiaensis]|uniref:septal ring lytic transglycosylase RlpA family protein n=1 Tax=Rubrolithibacter danxiaensis TaxID=3390805 RepID=UPI003BF87A92
MQIRLLLFLLTFLSLKSVAATRIDSIGTESNNGKKIIIHKIEAKETYYSLGRKYHVSPKDIISFNNNTALHIGTIIKVPTERPYTAASSSVPANIPSQIAEDPLIDYKVGPKETLFAIAKRFGTTIEEIKKLNHLKSNSLSIGQLIKVPGKSSDTPPKKEESKPTVVYVPTTTVQDNTVVADNDSTDSDKQRVHTNRYGLREIDERGVAVWIADENLDSTKMLVLHRTAPVGTIIKITNPMTDRSTFAKVVGRFTENETTKDVVIVVTKATADLLGALDKRFQVSLVYGVPNE